MDELLVLKAKSAHDAEQFGEAVDTRLIINWRVLKDMGSRRAHS